MTSLARGSRTDGRAAAPAAAATRLAADAAAAAGVTLRVLDGIDGAAAADELFRTTWASDSAASPVSSELMVALGHSGNYVAGAFDHAGLVGACVGFFGEPERHTMHSHIAAVAPSAQGRSVGYALKLHQLIWAMERGVQEITWTFDPLVRRNAYFNVAKLGATPSAYLPNFYGAMADAINAGQETDRLLVSWRVTPEVETGRRDTEPEGARVLLDEDDAGRPTFHTAAPGQPLLLRVPASIEALRADRPRLAADWRTALRETLGGLMQDGHEVIGFSRSGCYVLAEALS